jgi:hypothetical protein
MDEPRHKGPSSRIDAALVATLPPLTGCVVLLSGAGQFGARRRALAGPRGALTAAPRAARAGRWAGPRAGPARAGGRRRRCAAGRSTCRLRRGPTRGPTAPPRPPRARRRRTLRPRAPRGSAGPAIAAAQRRAALLWFEQGIRRMLLPRARRTTCCAAPWRCTTPRTGRRSVRRRAQRLHADTPRGAAKSILPGQPALDASRVAASAPRATPLRTAPRRAGTLTRRDPPQPSSSRTARTCSACTAGRRCSTRTSSRDPGRSRCAPAHHAGSCCAARAKSPHGARRAAHAGPLSCNPDLGSILQEDDAIVRLVAELGPKAWSKIAAQLPGRIGKQCRERCVALEAARHSRAPNCALRAG